MISVADGWCGNKKGIREIGGIWRKKKKEALASHENRDGRNIYKNENYWGAKKMRCEEFSLCFG